MEQKQIDDFLVDWINSGGEGNDEIKQLYESIPFLNETQQKTIVMYRSLGKKYGSEVLTDIADKVEDIASRNKPIGFRFSRMLEAVSLHKHFKGYRMSTSRKDDSQ